MRETSSSLVMLTLLLGLSVISITEVAAGQVATNRTTNTSNDDVFTPFQGDRFDVFDWGLCRNLGKKYAGNMLISPISVKLALILLWEGSEGQTAHELAGALELSGNQAMTRDRFSTVVRSLQTSQPEYELDISTRLFFDTSFKPRQRYSMKIKTFYSADVVSTNMTDARVSLGKINEWVKNVTHGHVTEILSDEEKLRDSVLLVMNALYFKGSWRLPFSVNSTRPGTFYTGINESVQVAFMSAEGRYHYVDSAALDAQVLRLPYLGHKFAMFIVLPHAKTGLRQLLQDINPFVLRRHIATMAEVPIDVIIPKFKFEFTSHLEAVLRELGIRDIFDNTATLPGILGARQSGPRLMVSDFVQKAGIEVNEAGTTVHAVTEVQIGNKIIDTIFHVTHPFLFYIEDETTGTIIFVGKVTNPLETSGVLEEPVPDVPMRSSLPVVDAAPIITPGKTKG